MIVLLISTASSTSKKDRRTASEVGIVIIRDLDRTTLHRSGRVSPENPHVFRWNMEEVPQWMTGFPLNLQSLVIVRRRGIGSRFGIAIGQLDGDDSWGTIRDESALGGEAREVWRPCRWIWTE